MYLIHKKKEIKRNKAYIGSFTKFGVYHSLSTLFGRQCPVASAVACLHALLPDFTFAAKDGSCNGVFCNMVFLNHASLPGGLAGFWQPFRILLQRCKVGRGYQVGYHLATRPAGCLLAAGIASNDFTTEHCGNVSLLSTVGQITQSVMEDEKRGGHSTHRCGGLAAGGRKPTVTVKNANMDVCVFYFLAAHSYGCGLFLPL